MKIWINNILQQCQDDCRGRWFLKSGNKLENCLFKNRNSNTKKEIYSKSVGKRSVNIFISCKFCYGKSEQHSLKQMACGQFFTTIRWLPHINHSCISLCRCDIMYSPIFLFFQWSTVVAERDELNHLDIGNTRIQQKYIKFQ